MAMLLNRKYGSRLECLYYILSSCYAKFGTTREFTLNDLKFDEEDANNVHHYCQQLIDCVGIQCCPFLKNPLNASKCYATQSVDSDSTKSKAASDIAGSLEALGFISRNSKHFRVSAAGEKWVNCDFASADWETIALEGVLSYGVVIGFLSKLRPFSDVFSYSGLYLSYPQTEEIVAYTDDSGSTKHIRISTDSQRDSNTRTISKIIGWCVAVGLLEPQNVKYDTNATLAHIKYKDFLNKDELTVRTFKKTDLCKTLFNSKRHVANPLAYSRLHKNVRSLRENGGEDLRKATMAYNRNILDRRFVFVLALNRCSRKNINLSFTKLTSIMDQYAGSFFSAGNSALDIMSTECEIADITGIPFDIQGDELIPLTTINEAVLKEDASAKTIRLAETILQEMGLSS